MLAFFYISVHKHVIIAALTHSVGVESIIILKYIAFTFVAAVILLAGMFYYVGTLGLSNGYKMQWQPFEKAYLASETAIAVEPTVLSVDFSGDYIAGLLISSTHFDCDGEQQTQYSEQNSFFIVNTLSHERMDFVSQAAFEAQLQMLGLAEKIFMDFEAFYHVAEGLRKEQPNDNQLLGCKKTEVALNDK